MDNKDIEYPFININELKPYKNNARLHPQEQINKIVNSINEFGFITPVIIDENNTILVGHGRTQAAKAAGLTKVPYRRITNLTDEQKRAYILADNKLSDIAEWDDELLQMELESISLDMTAFGFDDFTIDIDEDEEAEVVEDEVPELPEEARAQLGDLYKLGKHRLICGDSLNEKTIYILLNGEKCELTFTDPPYELKTKGGGILKTANSMKQIAENGVDTFNPSELRIYSDTNIYCHNKPLIKKYIELAEYNKLAYDLCFYKKLCSVPNYKGHMMTDCEYIAIIGKQDPNKGLEKELYSKCYIGKKDSDNELSYSKPVELCAKYIKLYSQEKVLDMFGGSGSTLIACEQLGRTCYMCELDPKYVDVIIERWENLTGQKAELIRGGRVNG